MADLKIPWTQLVHTGEKLKTATQTATVSPIHLSTTFLSQSPEEMDAIFAGDAVGFTYARHGSPNIIGLSEALKSLENAAFAEIYATGMAAVHGAFLAAGLKAGDTVLISRDIYGASLSMAREIFAPFDVKTVTADLTDLELARAVVSKEKPRLILYETISNPLLRVADVATLTEIAHAHGAKTIVDNTFATPLMIRPLDYGADFVVHSTTKYLSGHGDALGGVVVTKDAAAAAVLHKHIKLTGANLGPFEAWLTHRGLKTLGLRFVRQAENAAHLALRLADTGLFAKVHYPLLPTHPDFAKREQLLPSGLGGAVVTIELPGAKPEAFEFMRSLQLVTSATTVGDIYTLCLYPVIASHRPIPAAEREAMGITEGMLRLAIGIEDVEDLFNDIVQAAKKANALLARS